MRKTSFDEVQKVAQSFGFRCLSDHINSVDESLKWECKQGHRWTTKFYHIKTSHGCPECSKGISERICRAYFENYFNEKFPSTKRLQWLKNSKGNFMELDGYCDLLKLAFEYHGHQHFNFVDVFHKDRASLEKRKKDDAVKRKLCQENSVRLIEIPYSVQHKDIGQYILEKCDEVGIEVPFRNKELDYLTFEIYSPDKLKFYHTFAEKKNAMCLSKVYVNNVTPLMMKCSICDTIWKIRPANIKSGKWCPICARSKVNGLMEEKYELKRRTAFEKVKEIVKSKNAILVSNKIDRKDTKLKVICNSSHHFLIRYDHLLNGHFCKKCADIFNSDKQRSNLEEMQKIAQLRKGKCLSKDYINSHANLWWSCDQGHLWKATPINVKRGTWCQNCYREGRKKKL